MRILYFHQHFTTPAGTSGTRSYEFARALIARGHRVTMFCGQYESASLALQWDPARNWSRGEVDGIQVIALPIPYSNRDGLPRRAWFFLRYAWRSAAFALREDYDLLFATSTPLTAAIPGLVMKCFRRRKPFVFEVRDLWPELPRALGMKNPLLLWGMGALEWLAYRAADACVGLSPGIVEGIRRRSPRDRRIAMIPNCCDLELFTPEKRGPRGLPGITPGDFVAVFTGAHGVANGLGAVLDAAGELKRRGRRGIRLVLIGDGNQKNSLVARARRESLDNCLFFSPVKKTEIARITASMDCGLQVLANVPAFYHGTSPNKFFDYIAAGLPVVNNYPGWLADLITENRCGLVVRPGDREAFADALCRLADHPDERLEMGRRARDLAGQSFGRAEMARRLTVLLEGMVGAK